MPPKKKTTKSTSKLPSKPLKKVSKPKENSVEPLPMFSVATEKGNYAMVFVEADFGDLPATNYLKTVLRIAFADIWIVSAESIKVTTSEEDAQELGGST